MLVMGVNFRFRQSVRLDSAPARDVVGQEDS
jgi:hypothetical protein